MSRLRRADEMPCAASRSAWVSAEQYESMREQALAAKPVVESDGETICLVRQPKSEPERAGEQAGKEEVKEGGRRLIVVLADLVVGQERGQAHERREKQII